MSHTAMIKDMTFKISDARHTRTPNVGMAPVQPDRSESASSHTGFAIVYHHTHPQKTTHTV